MIWKLCLSCSWSQIYIINNCDSKKEKRKSYIDKTMLHQNIYNVFIPKNKTYLFTNHNVFSHIRRNTLIKFSKFITVHGTTTKVIVWWNMNTSSNLIVKFFYTSSITDGILCACARTILFAHTWWELSNMRYINIYIKKYTNEQFL